MQPLRAKQFVGVQKSTARGGKKDLKTTLCRDCDYEIEPGARGCPRCALNLEAEKMIDRFIWLRIMPGLIIAGVLGAGLLFYFLRLN